MNERAPLRPATNVLTIAAAFTSTGFTIADPQDFGMLDMVGFDSAGPAVVADFMRG